jgi:CRISPR-associated protein Csm4
MNGEAKLKELLAALEKPVLVLSSAFPEDTLPAPKLYYPPPEQTENLSTELQARADAKAAKKINYLATNIWTSRIGGFDAFAALQQQLEIERFLKVEEEKEKQKKKIQQEIVMHNSINRNTGTTGKGTASLYAESVTFAEENSTFDSYLQTDYFSLDELTKLFSFIESSGFGRNKHTGRGKFVITLQPFSFPEVEDPNAWLVLSNMVPAKNDPPNAGYDGFVKYGKLGGSYASGGKSPYKKPLFMLKPGAVFFGDKPPIGSLVKGIHPDDEAICQNAYALCMGFKHLGGNHAQ